MRILYICQYFVPPEGIGSTRHFEMAKRLVKQGHHVTILTSSFFYTQTPNNPYQEQSFVIDGIHILVINNHYEQSMGFVRRLLSFFLFSIKTCFAHIERKFDIVFASSTPLTIGIPAMFWAYRLRSPMVFEVRDLWPEVPISMGIMRSRFLIGLARTLEKLIYRNSARIVALTSFIKDGIATTGYPKDKIEIIPNACDFDKFDISSEYGTEFKKRYPEYINRPWIVYAGSLGKVHGVQYLIQVADYMKKSNSNAVFILIGPGSETENLKYLCKSRGLLDETVVFLSPLSKNEIPKVLSAATICCSTASPDLLDADSTNKFFDALAAGKPIFINHAGFLANLIQKHEAGIFAPVENPKCGAELLLTALSEHDKLIRMGCNAKNLGRKYFSRDILANQLEEVLKSACRNL